MAKYGHLPIFKKSYDMFCEVLTVSNGFPRDFKFTLGRDLYDVAMLIIKLIYRVNSNNDKKGILEDILSSTVEIGVLIRAAHDVGILSNEKYMSLMDKRDSIEKQASGWLKSL